MKAKIERDERKEILDNIRWFSKFSLEKRFQIAFEEIKSIKILRGLVSKKNAASRRAA